uniref:Uncharacterized protein n=1 Tax=Glossina austeni TaxID=7395 RepID=A0A1A9VWB3_GLOAU
MFCVDKFGFHFIELEKESTTMIGSAYCWMLQAAGDAAFSDPGYKVNTFPADKKKDHLYKPNYFVKGSYTCQYIMHTHVQPYVLHLSACRWISSPFVLISKSFLSAAFNRESNNRANSKTKYNNNVTRLVKIREPPHTFCKHQMVLLGVMSMVSYGLLDNISHKPPPLQKWNNLDRLTVDKISTQPSLYRALLH